MRLELRKFLPEDLLITLRIVLPIVFSFGFLILKSNPDIPILFLPLSIKYFFVSYIMIALLFALKDIDILGEYIKDERDRKNRQCWILIFSPFIFTEYMTLTTIVAICELVHGVRKILTGE